MKTNLLTIALVYALITLSSCGKDNYDISVEDENHSPTTIEVDNAISFGLVQNNTPSNTTGKALKAGTTYFIGSEDIEAQCDVGGSISGTFDGMGEYFFFLFNVNPTDTVVSFAGFETEIDGVPVLADNAIIPDQCHDGKIEVDFEETEDRIFGTFKGEFFTYVQDIVLPLDSCVNYRSLGILEASFNVELLICD